MDLKTARNKKFPTTTSHQSRLQFYEPTKIPKGGVREISTPFGSARVEGRLGQGHADLMEAISFYAESYTCMPNGTVEVLIDLYKVRVSMGGGKYYSYEGLFVRVKDVMKAIVEMTINLSGEHILCHLIERMEKSKEVRRNPLNSSAERNPWVVTFSKEYLQLLDNDLVIYYDPKPIARLSSGITQAIVRYLLTHKGEPNGGWILDNLFVSVGAYSPKKAQVRKWRIRVKEDALNLLPLGFQLTEDSTGRLRLKKIPIPLGD